MCAMLLMGTKLMEAKPVAVVSAARRQGVPTRYIVWTSASLRSPSSAKRARNSERMCTEWATPTATSNVGTATDTAPSTASSADPIRGVSGASIDVLDRLTVEGGGCDDDTRPRPGLAIVSSALVAARFPYVTPSGWVRYCVNDTERDLYLVDGGYFENTGLLAVLDAFDEGAVVSAGDDIASADYVALLEQIPALADVLRDLGLTDEQLAQPAMVASGVEFVLEGLHLNKRLNKEAVGGAGVYRARA